MIRFGVDISGTQVTVQVSLDEHETSGEVLDALVLSGSVVLEMFYAVELGCNYLSSA